MTVCTNIKRFSRAHETIADVFSLLAVVLLFASIWATLEYHQPVLHWLGANVVVNTSLLVVGLAANAFLIVGLLAVGSARHSEDNERCFGTFRGRRSQRGGRSLFSNWIRHMENVGKRHR